MNLRTSILSFCLLFLGFQTLTALPTTPKSSTVTTTEVNQQEKVLQKTISSSKKQKKLKKGFFNRVGQNFLVKRIKKMVDKHLGTSFVAGTSAPTTFKEDIANADDQDVKDAKLIGILCGALLGLLGVLGVAIFFKKGPRKKAALRGAWLGFGILFAIGLILALV